MEDFLRFVDELSGRFPVHAEIYYSKITDWVIRITRKGCAGDYPQSARDGDDAVLVWVDSNDMELCFARAHVALKEWLLEHDGGY